MLIDSIVNDPAWNNGNYTEQPPNVRTATFWFATATSGGNQRWQAIAPTSKEGDAYVDASAESSGHGTTGSSARLYAEPLAKFLKDAPRRPVK